MFPDAAKLTVRREEFQSKPKPFPKPFQGQDDPEAECDDFRQLQDQKCEVPVHDWGSPEVSICRFSSAFEH
jgi:hypothetical protein